MGDRRNVIFKDGGEGCINLYTHWCGTDMPQMLAEAIDAARPRWNDTPYCTRIIISRIIGDQWKDKTGWGLSTDEEDSGDSGNEQILVNVHEKQVVMAGLVLPFEEFVTAALGPKPAEAP